MIDKNKIKEDYKSTLKSKDTEEWFDLIFYRPLGYGWALLAKKLHVTPNAITIASIFLGIGSGVCFYFNNFWINVIACLLLVWANSFDSADGQLARMTKQYSRLGRILDGVSGDIWFIAIYLAICLRENVTSTFFMEHIWVIWVVAVTAGIMHGVQASAADYYRQFHLYILKGQAGSELDNAQAMWQKYHSLTWSKNFMQKLVLAFYANHTSGQEKRTPSLQRLRRLLQTKYGDTLPKDVAERVRAASLPMMKYTNILTFNVRSFALFIAVLVFRMPWLYFAFEIVVMTVILIYMMVSHEMACRRLLREFSAEGQPEGTAVKE